MMKVPGDEFMQDVFNYQTINHIAVLDADMNMRIDLTKN